VKAAKAKGVKAVKKADVKAAKAKGAVTKASKAKGIKAVKKTLKAAAKKPAGTKKATSKLSIVDFTKQCYVKYCNASKDLKKAFCKG